MSLHHIQDDAVKVAYGQYWDLMIAHPPCTWLSVSGLHWNYKGRQGLTPEQCWKETDKARRFFIDLMDAPIPRIAVENPIGIMSRWSKPDQIIQPYEFGHNASKRTCLWIKSLPLLPIDPSKRVAGRLVEWPVGSGKMVERWDNQTDSGQNRLGPSETRSADRARFYSGWADAMAATWG